MSTRLPARRWARDRIGRWSGRSQAGYEAWEWTRWTGEGTDLAGEGRNLTGKAHNLTGEGLDWTGEGTNGTGEGTNLTGDGTGEGTNLTGDGTGEGTNLTGDGWYFTEGGPVLDSSSDSSDEPLLQKQVTRGSPRWYRIVWYGLLLVDGFGGEVLLDIGERSCTLIGERSVEDLLCRGC